MNSKKAPVQGWEKPCDMGYRPGDAIRAQLLKEAGLNLEQYRRACLSVEEFIDTLAAERQKWAEEIRGMARDHYWDSLSEDSGLIIKHIDGILSKLERGGE